MREAEYIWLNGRLVKWWDAKIHVLSHALHYGTGIFEGMRCYNTKIGPALFRPREHYDRMIRGAKLYRMEIPYGREELMMATKELIRANGLKECYVRPIAFFGYGQMGVNPAGCVVDVAIAVWEWGRYLGEGSEKGVRVMVSSWRRIDNQVLMPNVKCTGHYINAVLAKVEAVSRGYQEAIMLNPKGYVAEGSGENIFIVKDGSLYTPPLSSGILPGITRMSAMEIARDLGIMVVERELTREDLYSADEAFFTGTAAEITPIVEVDGIRIGDGSPGEITTSIGKVFARATKGEEDRYLRWLEPVYE